ncbi:MULTISPECIES: helix-turn-helix domain-containing protein [Arthrobacter]|uniref:Helix-turn-helix domain-containing protein n=2 Tax=Arthrobacter TaxID=1663 RepID=A0ABU9KSZ3_9MICC|nr:helix-turn-helix domain-containing protein [Arthrobacter sp. YJM1]MDP5228612.1 helix-turn-helix domain-containing protein [Arthrobacter sp. YJM1]
MDSSRHPDPVGAIGALGDPTRRAVYDFLRRRGGECSKADVADGLGLAPSTAAFHLERLAEEGLLVHVFRRLNERRGPGAGRPAKLYRVADAEILASVPERRYELAGELMAAAIDKAGSSGSGIGQALGQVGAQAGRNAWEHAAAVAAGAAQAADVDAVLSRHGYEPVACADGSTELRNCPFHRLAQVHPDTICGLNQAYLSGLLEHDPEKAAVLDPGPGRCCVRILPQDMTPTPGTPSSRA